ncbi:MAG: carboxymuconolactone decarboxylase family protein [Terriglobia bacterium]
MRKVPKRFQRFTKEHPEVAIAYEKLGTACHAGGPLNEKERALVKLGISIGARLEGGVHSHVRKALDVHVRPDQIVHVALLSLPTLGLPSMMAAMSWVDDILSSSKPRSKRQKK